jgi:Tol biopolymer transport system component
VRADGTVKVLDVGLAKALDGPAGAAQEASPTVTSADLTRQGAMLGTVAYMSPEQIKGRPATRRSDTANTSGRPEVYVRSFPSGGTTTQVSVNGGAQARWRPDGRELCYLVPDSRQLIAVPVQVGADRTITLGAGTALFAMDIGHVMNSGPSREYVPSADGQRVLVNLVLQDPRPTPLRLVLNWAR